MQSPSSLIIAIISSMLAATSIAALTISATPAAAIDCDRWYSPSASEKVDPPERAFTKQNYSVRRAPSDSSACERGVAVRTNTVVEIHGHRGEFAYTRNPANNDYGWIKKNVLNRDGSTKKTGGSSPEEANPTDLVPTSAESNLAMLQATSARNTNHDNSRFLQTPSRSLPLNQLIVSWHDYKAAGEVTLRRDGGHVSPGFRVACEFSHFAYDDPIIFPNEPATSHLHMFFGNTEANAFSTADSLLNTGSSTCNGQELNRTAYWVPAFIDKNGDLPVPDEALVYYKAHGSAVGNTEVYPAGMRFVSGNSMSSTAQSTRELGFSCFGPNGTKGPKTAHIPNCANNQQLEMNVRFQTCWNGLDPTNYQMNTAFSNEWPTSGRCSRDFPHKLPQLEYRILYSDHQGSSSWILSSDVSMRDRSTVLSHGYSLHGDWFGGWNAQINQQWIDRCVNRSNQDCDEGLLEDPNTNANAQALRLRPEFTGPSRLSGARVLKDLCPREDRFSGQASVALCG